MIDDDGDPLAATLRDVMYIPGLSRCLFSTTQFAKHGHFATIHNGSTTLCIGLSKSPVTLTNENSHMMAADVTVSSTSKKPHLVPCSRNHNHTVSVVLNPPYVLLPDIKNHILVPHMQGNMCLWTFYTQWCPLNLHTIACFLSI